MERKRIKYILGKAIEPAKKMLIIGMAVLAIWLLVSSNASACTAVYVGKDVSDDGTVIIARSNDSMGSWEIM